MANMLQFDPSRQSTPNLHTPDGDFYRQFVHSSSISNNEETEILAQAGMPFESIDFDMSGLFDADMFGSFNDTEDLPHRNGLTVHEQYQEPPNFPVEDEVHYASPKSLRFSEDPQSIIPEHYGPGCWLSICSPVGIDWVQQRAGHDGFDNIAAELLTTWAKQLRLEQNEANVRSSEPDPDQAWKYSNAYFEKSVDSIFEVVYRPEFEWHLRNHLENKGRNDDPAWYALRNTVYASGCRLHHSANHAASFTEIHEEAWSYFSNALSVHSDLLLRSPSLRAVRALLAMAIFAEGLGSPALGSGLIANAALVSQSLGLHRKVVIADCALDSETLQRLWLFWAVYCCEKNIARRIGRPSVIDDDDIGCDIPTVVHSRSAIDPTTFTYIIRSCQISGRLCKRLMSAKGLDRQPAKVLEIVAEFAEQLRSWKESLPLQVRPKDRPKQPHFSLLARTLGIALLLCSYYDLLMVLHAPFSYPWSTQRFPHDSNANTRVKVNSQIVHSSEATVEAARNIIIMARNFEINGANTHAFMLHYPMHAFINLFIHIIKFPRTDLIRTDLALLDVAAGYFGQMDFVTGGKLSFPFVRDIATFGRQIVDAESAQLASPHSRNV